MAQRFRKKPVEIEALQIDPSTEEVAAGWTKNAHSVAVILGWFIAHNFNDFRVRRTEGSLRGLAIETLEGLMFANPGDWIIRGVQGEFYPCKPDIFAATYEAVES